MVFNSYAFLLFFPLVLILLGLLPARCKNMALLLASYYYYSCWGKRYCLLLLGCTAVVYAAALLLEKRKWTFWAGLTVVLGSLAVFKYADFALYTLEQLLGKTTPRLNLMMPIRGNTRRSGTLSILPCSSPSFRSFFPGLSAGAESCCLSTIPPKSPALRTCAPGC